MTDDNTDPMRIPCRCWFDAEGNLIPNEACELHWHQVIIDKEGPPVWQFQ